MPLSAPSKQQPRTPANSAKPTIAAMGALPSLRTFWNTLVWAVPRTPGLPLDLGQRTSTTPGRYTGKVQRDCTRVAFDLRWQDWTLGAHHKLVRAPSYRNVQVLRVHGIAVDNHAGICFESLD